MINYKKKYLKYKLKYLNLKKLLGGMEPEQQDKLEQQDKPEQRI